MSEAGERRGELMAGEAFGAPGIPPTWASSDKDFVTTALGNSRLWATIGHGIVNEIYWPSTGRPEIRDIGFYLIGADRWIDLKRVSRYAAVQAEADHTAADRRPSAATTTS